MALSVGQKNSLLSVAAYNDVDLCILIHSSWSVIAGGSDGMLDDCLRYHVRESSWEQLWICQWRAGGSIHFPMSRFLFQVLFHTSKSLDSGTAMLSAVAFAQMPLKLNYLAWISWRSRRSCWGLIVCAKTGLPWYKQVDYLQGQPLGQSQSWILGKAGLCVYPDMTFIGLA